MVQRFLYDYDCAGNILFEKRVHDGKGDSYYYDSMYRLDTWNKNRTLNGSNDFSDNGSSRFFYNIDGLANRKSIVIRGDESDTIPYSFDNMNHYTAVDGVSRTKDNNGNLISYGTNQYWYDYNNQMVRSKTSNGTYEYKYDALGRRIEKKKIETAYITLPPGVLYEVGQGKTYSTITSAISAIPFNLTNNAIIKVYNGVYSGVDINKNTGNYRIYLVAAENNQPAITTAGIPAFAICVSNTSKVTIYSFEIYLDQAYADAIRVINGNYVEIFSCNIHDLSDSDMPDDMFRAIYASNADNLKIERCVSFNCHGFVYAYSCDNLSVTNNMSYNQREYHIWMESCAGSSIYYNTLALAANNGIIALGTTSGKVKNNIIANDWACVNTLGICLSSSANSSMEMNYNDIFNWSYTGAIDCGAWQRTLSDWRTYSKKEANSIASEPVFISTEYPLDLHICHDSPCVNTGVSGTGITRDFDNQVRGLYPDIGADEFSSDNWTKYFYEGPHCIEQTDLDGEPVRTYVFGAGIDSILSMHDEEDGADYFYLTNRIGSVTGLCNSSGAIIEKYYYTAFGEVTIFDEDNNLLTESAVGNTIMFQVRELDVETGLYYFRARMYDPATGRFLSYDPLGYKDSMSMYQAFGGNPINRRDPFGKGGMPLDMVPGGDPNTVVSDEYMLNIPQILYRFKSTYFHREYNRMLAGSQGRSEEEKEMILDICRDREKTHENVPPDNIYSYLYPPPNADMPEEILDAIQYFLDFVGLVFDPADIANGYISLSRGNNTDAALCFSSSAPFIGIGATVGKWGKKLVNAAEASEDIAKGVAKSTSKTESRIVRGESAATIEGREVHKKFANKIKEKAQNKPGWESEPQDLVDPLTGRKVVPDAVTPSGRPLELKPDTLSGHKSGAQQLKKYERTLEKKGRVIYYGPEGP
jgi:RHS repeat-associated protein